jgi:hypothetical protein
MGIQSGERFGAADPPESAKPRQQDSICWYVTLGGCQVTVSANDQGGYSYRCEGCNAQQDKAEGRVQTLFQANEHAAQCRAISNLRSRDVADIARELTADVRAELPRIDARAAAGVALSAAVLIGAVGQAQPMPILAFMVVAAALLTIALLLFFTVLLPVTAKGSQISIRRWATFETGEALADELASWDRALYHTTAAIELSSVVRTKQTRLTLGLYAGALAVLALATGAAYSLFVGFR